MQEDQELDAWLREHLFNECPHEWEYYCIEDGNSVDSGHTCKRCGIEMYQDKRKPVTTWEGMGAVIEAMRGKEFQLDLKTMGNQTWARFYREGTDAETADWSLAWDKGQTPRAVALAAKSALMANESRWRGGEVWR